MCNGVRERYVHKKLTIELKNVPSYYTLIGMRIGNEKFRKNLQIKMQTG